MVDIYKMVGITKQGHYNRLLRRNKRLSLELSILESAAHIRVDHRRMGCRKLYNEIQPFGLGRDATERLLLSNGFRLSRKRSYHRTTYAGGHRYDNLISGIDVMGKNEVFVSDITYIPIGIKKNYYLSLVLDVYTRRIMGWSVSNTMKTEDTVEPAFLMAISGISKEDCKRLVFHSDRGSQYGSDIMKTHHEQTGVKPSMGGKAWENAHAESLNGILKNEYINFEQRGVSLKEAYRLIKKWIYLYNHGRPHGSLKKMKPSEFETYVEQLAVQHRPIFRINY